MQDVSLGAAARPLWKKTCREVQKCLTCQCNVISGETECFSNHLIMDAETLCRRLVLCKSALNIMISQSLQNDKTQTCLAVQSAAAMGI